MTDARAETRERGRFARRAQAVGMRRADVARRLGVTPVRVQQLITTAEHAGRDWRLQEVAPGVLRCPSPWL